MLKKNMIQILFKNQVELYIDFKNMNKTNIVYQNLQLQPL